MNTDDQRRPDDPLRGKATPAADDQPDAASAASLETMREARDQLEEQLRRALADAANMRRRQQQESAESRRRIVEGFTQELLPVVDSFQLALQAAAEGGPNTGTAALLDGVRLVQSLLMATLERHGLQEIAAQDQPFDPARHEAVAVEARKDVEPGKVLKVLQPGYLLADRVLRHAKVLVSGAPPAGPTGQS